jgi:amidophosphoribosyltransferase
VCGIIGIHGDDDVASELIYGLSALQHRGQDAAGIVTFDRKFHLKKGTGLVLQVFGGQSMLQLKGKIGLGHVRYSTQGTTALTDAQPFTAYHPFGLAMVHNGNVTNFETLRQSLASDHFHLIESSNDIELILHTLAHELRQKNLRSLTVEDIFAAVDMVRERVEGAYAVIAIIAGKGMLAFMDPAGIRPLVLGQRRSEKGVSFAFASESRCFDSLDYELMHTLKGGEALFIDNEAKVYAHCMGGASSAFCVFEYIYFAKEDSVMHGRSVAVEREQLGRELARHVRAAGLAPEVVIDVPSSSYFFAQGLADALEVPYRVGLVRNQMTPRSFIAPTQQYREQIVREKANAVRAVVEGKRVAVVDDSIVRGTTSSRIVHVLRRAGAKEVYFVSGSPPLRHTCPYGIDMSQSREMVAARCSFEEIRNFIGAEALIYPTVVDLRAHYKAFGMCDACFSGDYPTAVTQTVLNSIDREKLAACR